MLVVIVSDVPETLMFSAERRTSVLVEETKPPKSTPLDPGTLLVTRANPSAVVGVIPCEIWKRKTL